MTGDMTGDMTTDGGSGAPAQEGRQEGRKIIHVDMDAFFASVEQRDDPDLRGRPVAVGGSRQRGVVAAASYEARVFGVRSAMPSMRAIRLCPDLVFVKPRFEVYKAVSGDIRAIFADYTSLIEPLSLDEAYLDVTVAARASSATRIAEEIRARIREATGLTASAGVSYNKFLAKLASDHRKPDGLTVVPPGKGEAFVAALDIGRFHGVGPVTAQRMRALGIATGADLRLQSAEALDAAFGKAGRSYYWAGARDRRPPGAGRPDPQIERLGADLLGGSPRRGRPSGRARAFDRKRVAALRGLGPLWSHRDAESEIRRLPPDHPRPHARRTNREPRAARDGRARVAAGRDAAADRRAAARPRAVGVRGSRGAQCPATEAGAVRSRRGAAAINPWNARDGPDLAGASGSRGAGG